MTADRWETIRSIFHAALDVEPDRQDAFLRSVCADTQTRNEVQDLLIAAGEDDFLETPALGSARAAISAASAHNVHSHLSGVVLGERYRLSRLLARGGHGLVFAATDLRLSGRPIVVKILDSAAEHQKWLQRRFRQEIEILGRIAHPGVVGIQDCGETAPGQPWLVMDFIEGVTLRQLIRSGIDRKEVAVIAEQMGSALRAAHAQGVFHRDLKPENVMVQRTAEAPGLRVTLIDFGIAHMERAETKGTTTVLMIAGTVKYMAPEQFLGIAVAESDIYAFAVVCFEMLTGSPPYDASDPLVLANEQRNKLPARLVDRSGLPVRVRPLIAAALDFDLKRRPRDAEAFGRDVADLLRRPDPGWLVHLRLRNFRIFRGMRSLGIAAAIFAFVFALAWAGWRGIRPAAPASSMTRVNPLDGMIYVNIPAGTFLMGCSSGDGQCFDDEKQNLPRVEQVGKGFWLGRTEVTQAAWKKIKGANPSRFKGDQLPVESVNWTQANDYCAATGGRLPTEKEWEYAARAGALAARYGPLDAIAWYAGNSAGTTHPVGLKRPNAFGLYDMLGNVWEWTSDGPVPGTRAQRGGSWVDGDRFVRVSVRYRDHPEGYNYNLGFRCVLELR